VLLQSWRRVRAIAASLEPVVDEVRSLAWRPDVPMMVAAGLRIHPIDCAKDA